MSALQSSLSEQTTRRESVVQNIFMALFVLAQNGNSESQKVGSEVKDNFVF